MSDAPRTLPVRAAGFGSAEVMRRAVVRVVGTSPADYRARFTVLAGAAS
jgi:AraC-like DNA-binding protein